MWGAMLATVAIRSLPAPARSAAVAARIAVPGSSGDPATTSTRPRPSLSASSEGCGSGHARSRSGVTTGGTGRSDGPSLRCWCLDIRLGRDRCALVDERHDGVVAPEDELAALAPVRVKRVLGDRAVGDLVHPV